MVNVNVRERTAVMYLLIYEQDQATYDMEWYAPTNWTIEQVRAAFDRRYTRAKLISIHRVATDSRLCIV